jgi:hypothetical protein
MLTTLAEIDAALAATPPDTKARADLMRRYVELEQAERNRANVIPPWNPSALPHRPPLMTLRCPPGFTHVEMPAQSRVIRRVATRFGVEDVTETSPRRIAVEVVDGTRYVFCEPGDARLLLTGIHSGAWLSWNSDFGCHPHTPHTMINQNSGAPL